MPTDAPHKVMAGWDRAPMRIAADWLWDAFPPGGGLWDLGAVTIVTQGGRAGRILEAMLCERAEAGDVGLIPPMRLGPGEIADLVIDRPARPASPIARRLAWAAALRATPREALTPLVPVVPEADAHVMAIVAMVERAHTELAGEMLRFSEVPGRAETLASFDEADRWMAAAAVQDRYVEILAKDGWVDADLERVSAIRDGRVRDHAGPIVLVGVVELPGVARAALDRSGRDVRVLVFAPEAMADRFDPWGRPTAWWGERTESVLTHTMVRFADDPADQCEAAIEALGEITASPSPAEVVVGVPDESVVPALRRRIAEMGASGRPASGTPASRTRPVRLLSAIAEVAADPSWPPLASLIRHPDVVRWIDSAPELGEAAWLSAMDAHAVDRVPRTAMGSADHIAEGEKANTVRAVLAAVGALCGDLLSPDPRPVSAWAGAVRGLIDRAYPPGVDHEDHQSAREINEAIGAIERTLEELDAVAGTTIDAPMHAAQALAVIIEFCGRAAIPETPRDSAVDLVGWLELAADPARIVVVTGMNEGAVPSSVAHDPLLPDAMRRALGLVDDTRRVARDAYLVELIARQGREARFIVGRRNADGDPIVPSRLVLRAAPDALPAWVGRFTSGGRDPHRPARLDPSIKSGGADRFPVRPLVDTPKPVTAMSVTAFKAYIESPYGFYLRYVLGLSDVSDGDPELTPAGFGSLIHDAMHRFASHPDAQETSAARVERALMECLDEEALALLGPAPALITRMQVELARERLRRFAPAQAARRAEGWIIRHSEWKASDGPALDVDGLPMPLHGRIDRIDQHESNGGFAIIDFKTGDAGADPARAHRLTRGDHPWIDLQLPLYSILAASIIGDRVPHLGYGLLPSDVPPDPFRFTDWRQEDLDEAHDAAREVVRQIRAGNFQSAGRVRTHDPVTAALVRIDRDTIGESDSTSAPAAGSAS